VRTIEYAVAPLHYTIGRDTGDSKADYGNSANIERERRPAIAVSLRFNR
jgi:hypothetical protein